MKCEVCNETEIEGELAVLTGNTIASLNVALLKPDGTVLTSKTSSSGSFNLTTVTLPTTGTYVIAINPPSTNTGSLSVNVTSP